MGAQGLFRERSVLLGLPSPLCLLPGHNCCWCSLQLWPSTTTPRTRRMSCPSWKEPSSTSSRRMMTAGSKASATASRDSSQETMLSPSCTMLTKKRRLNPMQRCRGQIRCTDSRSCSELLFESAMVISFLFRGKVSLRRAALELKKKKMIF